MQALQESGANMREQVKDQIKAEKNASKGKAEEIRRIATVGLKKNENDKGINLYN